MSREWITVGEDLPKPNRLVEYVNADEEIGKTVFSRTSSTSWAFIDISTGKKLKCLVTYWRYVEDFDV